MFEEEPIWGMTAEIICDFIKTLKKKERLVSMNINRKLATELVEEAKKKREKSCIY